jgi:methylmalonyl-CoA/ethylmalonyl-CoA epimerase
MKVCGEVTRSVPDADLGMRIHHVGYAVPNISEYLGGYVSSMLQPRAVSPVIDDPIQGVRVVFVELPGGTLELIEPIAADSPVQQILNRKRGGLYHVGYTTPQFDSAMARAIAKGCRALAKPVPAAAFGQKRIVFFMTPHFDIIELIEMPERVTP